MDRRFFVRCGAATIAAAMAPQSWAQATFPSKPIKFVVPFAAGGGGDTVARMLAQRLSERINNPVVVENRTGAGGNIGTDFVLKSPPDGYTLLNMSSTYPIQAAVSKLPFDPIGDMQPIIMVSRDPVVLMVNPDSPLRDAKRPARGREEDTRQDHATAPRAWARSRTSAWRSSRYLMGVELLHVPYKGSSQAFTDLLGGKRATDAHDRHLLRAAHQGRQGARARHRRHAAHAARCADVPTFEEQGYQGLPRRRLEGGRRAQGHSAGRRRPSSTAS